MSEDKFVLEPTMNIWTRVVGGVVIAPLMKWKEENTYQPPRPSYRLITDVYVL